MADRAPSHDFVYAHSDIPVGMTIREWRARRATDRPATKPRSLRAAARRLLGLAAVIWRGGTVIA